MGLIEWSAEHASVGHVVGSQHGLSLASYGAGSVLGLHCIIEARRGLQGTSNRPGPQRPAQLASGPGHHKSGPRRPAQCSLGPRQRPGRITGYVFQPIGWHRPRQ